MLAEKSVMKVDRDMERYARRMAALKNSMDRAQLISDAKEKGREEERQYFLELLNQGLSVEEIKQTIQR